MKKISLLLLTTLMVTSAYSGGPADGGEDALSDEEFNRLLSKGAFGGAGAEGPEGSDGDANADVVVHDPVALRAAGGGEVVAPEEEERDRVVPSKGPMFDICEFFRTVGEGVQATVQGARDQLQRVPKVECPCVQRKLKQGEAAVDELVLEMRCWLDALQKRHDEARDKRKPSGVETGENVEAELRKELAAKDALLTQQEEQLAKLRANIDKLRPLFDAMREQKATT